VQSGTDMGVFADALLILMAQAGDLSQSPAQENVQGTAADAAGAATEPSNAATDTAAQLQPQKPLCDITATADSPHRSSKVGLLFQGAASCAHWTCLLTPAGCCSSMQSVRGKSVDEHRRHVHI
jgi:hypothetical protein